MLSITGEADPCSVHSHGAGWPFRRRPSRRPRDAIPATANPATAGQSGPSTSSCRSRSLDKSPSTHRRMARMLHDPPHKRPTAVLWDYREPTRGQIVRTRRNPASQTIILRLSQCSSRAPPCVTCYSADAKFSRANQAKARRFARPHRLTAGLPDVGTGRALPSDLIRAGVGHFGMDWLCGRL